MVDTTPGAVTHWTRGRRKPGARWRRALRERYEIPEGSWDEPVGACDPPIVAKPVEVEAPEPRPEPPARTIEPVVAPTQASSARDISARTVSLLNQQLEQLMKDPRSMPRERGQVAQALIAANRLYAKVSGVLELTESQVVRSEAWQSMMRLVLEALVPYPDAGDAVARALRNAEGV